MVPYSITELYFFLKLEKDISDTKVIGKPNEAFCLVTEMALN